ncbi:MAG: RNA polymerase sigma-70 factor [Streptosporangiales bacterium]|nr:RNA polymerase sigma-70 factor [Streptosporangiales bacterium]
MADLHAATEVFTAHRGLLFGLAYRILGRVADAEDVVQEAWLRWQRTEHDTIADARGFLVRVVNRLAIDRYRQAKARRECYVGEWLPEPLLTESAADTVETTETVSLAILVVLENLSPQERVVFVLHEAFDYPYAEIAEIVDRSEPAVRQLASRARAHVQDQRPRFDADATAQRHVTEQFVAAAGNGDVAGLLALLAPDVELHSDGGGKAKAPLRTIVGADKVARFLVAIAQEPPYTDPVMRMATVNGGQALVVTDDGRPVTVFTVDLRDGQIQQVRILANPDKLSGVSRVT